MARNASPDPQLLEAARRTFEAEGWSGATIERIAAEAGLSRVTLHRRGVTKDGLLEALVTRATEGYRKAMWPALTGRGSGAQRLQEALAALCDQCEQHMGVLLALRSKSDAVFHEPGEHGSMTATVFTEPFDKLLAEGAGDGSLRETDTVEMATVLFNLVGWTYIHLRTDHRWSPERARVAILDPVLHGLLTKAP